jgi:hypothetical protein
MSVWTQMCAHQCVHVKDRGGCQYPALLMAVCLISLRQGLSLCLSLSLSFFFFLFCFFRDRVSLYSPGCPGTHFLDMLSSNSEIACLCLLSALTESGVRPAASKPC